MGGGDQISENLADVMCERSLKMKKSVSRTQGTLHQVWGKNLGTEGTVDIATPTKDIDEIYLKPRPRLYPIHLVAQHLPIPLRSQHQTID